MTKKSHDFLTIIEMLQKNIKLHKTKPTRLVYVIFSMLLSAEITKRKKNIFQFEKIKNVFQDFLIMFNFVFLYLDL